MSDYRSRSRSRSPYHSPSSRSRRHKHSHHHSHAERHHRTHTRSQSPTRSGRSHRHTTHNRGLPPKALALGAAPISKHDLSVYRPLLGLYLDVQKQLHIEELPEEEIKGRWKSFVKKWNNGDLAEGWYDTKTFEKAKNGTFGMAEPGPDKPKPTTVQKRSDPHVEENDEDEDEDDFGPSLPMDVTKTSGHSQSARAGPSIPSLSDIRARNEETYEATTADRQQHFQDLRAERKADRKLQVDRQNELVPRAEPGTRERQLEKKREVASSNRAFAAAKDTGDVELRDADVMGEEDSLSELKRMKEMDARKRTDRELRREEILRARMAEREEKLKGLKDKEAKTMEMLKSIAKARFGGSGGSRRDGGQEEQGQETF